MHCVLHRLL